MNAIQAWFSQATLDDFLPWLIGAGRIIVVIAIGLIAVNVARALIDKLRVRMSARAANAGDRRRVDTLIHVVRYMVSIVIFVLTALIALGELGVSVAPILGAAGVAGIAVGFGAQSLVKDFFTGFFLLLEDQVRAGDVVKVAGLGGVVEEVSLRCVRLRDYEGNVHYIPNSNITTVTNMSRGFAYAVMDIGVSYDEDTDAVIEVMRETARQLRATDEMAGVILDDLDIAGVDRLDDSAVIIRCRFRVNALDQWGVRRKYLAQIKKAFQQHNIEIPYPHLKVLNSSGLDS